MATSKQLARVQASCNELADVVEKTSHGTPAWFAGGRQFAAWADDHHGDKVAPRARKRGARSERA